MDLFKMIPYLVFDDSQNSSACIKHLQANVPYYPKVNKTSIRFNSSIKIQVVCNTHNNTRCFITI